MFDKIDYSWYSKLYPEFSKPYFKDLLNFISIERKSRVIYPPDGDIFSCLKLTSFYDVNVVFVGQDPYCNIGQANGLAFSVNQKCKLPGSLVNIYKELYNDLGIKPAKHGNLVKWAQQGVLLLNTVLTVESGNPGSHFNIGWEFFTSAVVKILSDSNKGVIFVLLGKIASEKSDFINGNENIIIHCTHPSPISADKGFFGSRPFSKVNFNLRILMKKQIDWSVD